MSSAATAALYYPASVADVPVVMLAEPDDLTIMSCECLKVRFSMFMAVLCMHADTGTLRPDHCYV